MQLRNFSFLACLGVLFSLCCKGEAYVLASVKSNGMGQAAIAYPLDTLSIAYNPAGMLMVGDRLDLEFYWMHNKGSSRFSDNINSGVNGHFDSLHPKDIFLGAFGIVRQFGVEAPFEWCDCINGAIGIVGYDRDFRKTRFKREQPLFGNTRQGFEFALATISPAIAFELGECHSFGISFDWQVERVKLNGLETFDQPFISIHQGEGTNRSYNYAHGVTLTLGWRSQIWDCLAFGAVYQPKTHMSRFNKYKGFLVRGRLDVPEKIGLGFALYPCPCLAICFDAEWLRWNRVRGRSNSLLHDNVLMAFGSNNGPGFGFRNQWLYRVGIDYQVDDYWTIRAGFMHANTPLRSSQAFLNSLTLDLVQNYVTVGATWRFNCWNEFSAFFAYGFRHRLEGENAIPLIPFGGGDVNLNERKMVAGLSWGWIF